MTAYSDNLHPWWRTLYGTRNGRWLLVEGESDEPQPELSSLTRLGDPHAVIVHVHDLFVQRLPRPVGYGRRRLVSPVQQLIAGMCGVTQQTVSRWLRGTSRPEMSVDAWRMITMAWFDPDRALLMLLPSYHVIELERRS